MAHVFYILTSNEMWSGCFAHLAEMFSDSECIVFWDSRYRQFTSEEREEESALSCRLKIAFYHKIAKTDKMIKKN